jgi:hypothetical protein
LSVTDGVYTRNLFALSTLAIGSPEVPNVSLLVAPDNTPTAIVSTLPAALAAAFQALQPAAIASAIANLSSSDLTPLIQALIGALPSQTGAGAPVPSGQAFVNDSGFVVIAQ